MRRLAVLAREEGRSGDDVAELLERSLIEAALARHGGGQLRAAALGVNRDTLRKRLDALGLAPGRG